MYIPKTAKQEQLNWFYSNGKTHGLSKFRKKNLNYLIVGKLPKISRSEKRLLKRCEKWKAENPQKV